MTPLGMPPGLRSHFKDSKGVREAKASLIGDDWQPSAAQEEGPEISGRRAVQAFHRELQRARNSVGKGVQRGLGIAPPPGLAPGLKPQESSQVQQVLMIGAVFLQEVPRRDPFEALRSLGLENPPSLLDACSKVGSDVKC